MPDLIFPEFEDGSDDDYKWISKKFYVDPEKIEARYENGVLLVSIPKAERAKPREIRVNTSASGSTQVRTGSPSQRVGSGGQNRGGDGSRDPEEEGSAAKSQREAWIRGGRSTSSRI
jgi:hypothetical protein